MSAVERVRERRRAQRETQFRSARGAATELFVWSRLAIWIAALLALATLGPAREPPWIDSTHDSGYVADVWARWDSVWFLRIAEHGYSHAAAAFSPLYPALVAVLGRVLLGHYVLAGVLVSLACCLGAFVLLERIAEPRLGAAGARRAVLYLALFPLALFLQAVYSESLYLLLALAAFLLAERGRFLGAGAATALAILARLTGVALLPAVGLIAWRRGGLRRFSVSLLALPVYPLLLWQQLGDPWAFARSQGLWHRHLSPAGPLGGIWAAFTRWSPHDATPHARVVALDAEGIAFLVLFVALAVVAWRRFGAPYGLFAAMSLAIPLSVPSSKWALLSLPRFGLVVFPLFLALAALGRQTRVHAAIVGVSALLLGVFVVQWALWEWVA